MFGWFKKRTGGAQEPLAPPAPPPPQGPLSEAELKRALARPCAPLVCKNPATIDPFATMFGTVRLARKSEVWPVHAGAPLWPLCQINLTEAPVRPKAVQDLSLLTLFISPDHMAAVSPALIINTADPDPAATWALRSYATLDGLTIPNTPPHNSPMSTRLGEWAPAQTDYANHDMADGVVDIAANDLYSHGWCRTLAQTKLGGWPATVQSAPWWHDQPADDAWEFVMQIENEQSAGWNGWGDGAAYLARSRTRPHLWAIDVQFT